MARRKPKLPLASAGRVPDLKISEGDWTRIEKGYGRWLPDQLRSTILEITEEFLSWAEFEHTAPPVAQVENRIAAIKDATRAFVEAILRRPQNVTGLADFKAKQMICEYAQLPFKDGVDGLTRLAWETAVLKIPKACDAALTDLAEQRQAGGSFSGGTAWDCWVFKLTEAMTVQGLPTAARKDTDKRKSGGPSPFVAFVHELQQCIPDRFRRSTQSRNALAQAIYGARGGGSDKSNPASV